MGFSLSKAFGSGKISKKVFGKKISWGYVRKKFGIKSPFSFRSVPVSSASSASSIYGHTGSIVGKY